MMNCTLLVKMQMYQLAQRGSILQFDLHWPYRHTLLADSSHCNRTIVDLPFAALVCKHTLHMCSNQ